LSRSENPKFFEMILFCWWKAKEKKMGEREEVNKMR
jgi:hypothetical protein